MLKTKAHNRAKKSPHAAKQQKKHTKTPQNKKTPTRALHNHRRATFSTTTTDAPAQTTLPKIPRISYLKYQRPAGSEVFDVLPLLQERGFISQSTNMIDRHFQSAYRPKAAEIGDLDTTEQIAEQSQQDATRTTTTADATKPLPRRSIYAGFDPTASSLHLGNLLVILSLMHFHNAGHQIVALTGGATGMVGDPSGRSAERVLQTADQVQFNATKIHHTLAHLITNNRIIKQQQHNNIPGAHNAPTFVDNFDWYNGMSVINFLRDVGKNFRIASMLAKDSVKSRLNNQDTDGLSFTEFSYQVLQGYDFHHLFKNHNVTVQMGGSDQWGNITAGIDCINRMSPKVQPEQPEQQAQDKKKKDKKQPTPPVVVDNTPQAHGLTLPLLTTSSGVKFGKSMGNAIWLDSTMTSSYQMYQYLLSTTDADCEKFLKVFTFIDQDSIASIMKQHEVLPDVRIPQRVLAAEVVRLLHGDEGVKQAIIATKLLFKDKFDVDMSFYMKSDVGAEFDASETVPNTAESDNAELFSRVSLDDCLKSLSGVTTTQIPQVDLSQPEVAQKLAKPETHPFSAVNLAVTMKLVATKAEAKRLIKNGGLYVFNDKITAEDFVVDPKNIPYNRLLIMKAGQKKVHVGVFDEAVVQ